MGQCKVNDVKAVSWEVTADWLAGAVFDYTSDACKEFIVPPCTRLLQICIHNVKLLTHSCFYLPNSVLRRRSDPSTSRPVPQAGRGPEGVCHRYDSGGSVASFGVTMIRCDGLINPTLTTHACVLRQSVWSGPHTDRRHRQRAGARDEELDGTQPEGRGADGRVHQPGLVLNT